MIINSYYNRVLSCQLLHACAKAVARWSADCSHTYCTCYQTFELIHRPGVQMAVVNFFGGVCGRSDNYLVWLGWWGFVSAEVWLRTERGVVSDCSYQFGVTSSLHSALQNNWHSTIVFCWKWVFLDEWFGFFFLNTFILIKGGCCFFSAREELIRTNSCSLHITVKDWYYSGTG